MLANIMNYIMSVIVLVMSGAIIVLWIKNKAEKDKNVILEKKEFDAEIKAIDAHVNSQSLDELASDNNREYLASKTDKKE